MMNKKGLYSGIVAVVAIGVIAGFAFSSLGIANAEETMAGAESIADFKRQVQQAEFLFLRGSADALADSINTAGCGFDQAAAEAQATAYTNQIVSGLNPPFPACTINNVSVQAAGGPGNVNFVLDFSCQKNAGGIAISYDKTQFRFSKTYATPAPVPPDTCCVQVTDPDFGLEVNQCA